MRPTSMAPHVPPLIFSLLPVSLFPLLSLTSYLTIYLFIYLSINLSISRLKRTHKTYTAIWSTHLHKTWTCHTVNSTAGFLFLSIIRFSLLVQDRSTLFTGPPSPSITARSSPHGHEETYNNAIVRVLHKLKLARAGKTLNATEVKNDTPARIRFLRSGWYFTRELHIPYCTCPLFFFPLTAFIHVRNLGSLLWRSGLGVSDRVSFLNCHRKPLHGVRTGSFMV